MMSCDTKLYNTFREECNFLWIKLHKKSMRLGIACSGGPDSLLLCTFISKYKEEFPERIRFLVIIHIVDGLELYDHSIKPAMDKALSIVKAVSSRYNILLDVVCHTDTSKFSSSSSFESVCHEIRKNNFAKKIKEYDLDRIFVGHTKSDQIEHFFIGLIRKSSMNRIAGMKRDSGIYFRPLLSMTKESIVIELKKVNQEYIHDPCNDSLLSLRNNIRKNMLPELEKIDSRSFESIRAFMGQLFLYNDFIEKYVDKVLALGKLDNIKFFLSLDKIIQQKIIEKKLYSIIYKKTISLRIVLEIISFLESERGGKHIIFPNCSIFKKRGIWRIESF